MTHTVFEEMKSYIGFDPVDEDHLRSLADQVTPRLSVVVDRFYDQILRHPGARRAIAGGEQQVAALRISLTEWLQGLFSGTYDDEYCRRRSEIGHVHVRVGLSQHYMIAAMEIVWQELQRIALEADVPDLPAKLASLHKLLTLEAGMMLDSFKESYSEHVRQLERSAMRERLTQAEHLAQIGRLAASLAHEIKNPLAGISGAIQVIRDGMHSDAPHWPILGEVLRQINRLDGTVKDLLVYARPKPPRFQRCNVNRLIERILTVLRREPELQRVRLDYIDSLQVSLYADEVQIEQLLMNLVLNAADASPDGGTVRLTTSSNADGFRLVVEDRGHGMTEEACRRAFEPFYTTKAKGTGLGLPICQKIVEAHGGKITIRSTAGSGTVVTVRLPRYPPATSRGA